MEPGKIQLPKCNKCGAEMVEMINFEEATTFMKCNSKSCKSERKLERERYEEENEHHWFWGD